VWNAGTGRPVTPLLPHGGRVVAASFGDQTRSVTIASRGAVCTWRMPQEWIGQTETENGQNADRNVRAAKLEGGRAQPGRSIGKKGTTADGRRLEIRQAEGGIRVHSSGPGELFTAEPGTPLTPVMAHPGAVQFAAFSPDGLYVATADEFGDVRVWDSLSGELLVAAHRMQSPIVAMDEGKVKCADGAEYHWAPGRVDEKLEYLLRQAHVLAGRRIDENQQDSLLDAHQLRDEWEMFKRESK
jgi:WD40 repeat protein